MEVNMSYNKLEIAGWYISTLQSKNLTVKPEYPYCDITEDFYEVKGRAQNLYYGTRPIQDTKILDFTQSIDVKQCLQNNQSLSMTIDTFKQWLPFDIKSYNVDFVDGSLEAFNSLYSRYKNKTFYLLENEYWYNYELAKQFNITIQPLTKESTNGVVVLSYPFSYFGEDFLQTINKNNYVVLDLTYLPLGIDTINPFEIDADEYFFSLGKTWPIQQARTGFRISKKQINDYITTKNQIPQTNRLSTELIRLLMENFSYDYIISDYTNRAKILCKLFELQQSNIFTVAKGNLRSTSSYTFNEYNKNSGNRVCISSLLENYDHLTSRTFKELVNDNT